MASNRKNMGFMAPPPAFVDPNGVKYSVVGYSASQSSYVSETEHVTQYKGAPTILHEYIDKLNPGKLGLLNGHGRREGLPFAPWSSAHDERVGKFSTIDQPDPRFRNPARDHELKRGGESPPRGLVGHQYKKGDEFSPRAHVGHQPRSYDHDLREDDESSPKARVGQQPWDVIHDHGSKKGNGFSPKGPVQGGYKPNKGSPFGTYEPTRGSPRARDHGKYNHPSDESDDDDYGHNSDDDDYVCEDGVCYRKGSKPKLGHSYPNQDPDRTKLGHSYPNQDPERTKLGHSYPKGNNNDPQLHKGNDYNTPPFKSSLRDDRTRYEQSNDIPHPPRIKTKGGSRQGMDLRNDQSPRDSPRFGAPHQPQYGSPRKEYQGRMETIDRGEAPGRYDSTSPHGGVYVQQRYGRVIDSKTAAEKYNGVIL